MMNDPYPPQAWTPGRTEPGSWPFTCLDSLITSPSHGSLCKSFMEMKSQIICFLQAIPEIHPLHGERAPSRIEARNVIISQVWS